MPVGDGPEIISSNGVTRFVFPRPGAQSFLKENQNAHANSYGVVYVNDIAHEDIASRKTLIFRPGAIIVREKLADANSKMPELLAVMMKRENGFNPAANDWEFLILNGGATKVQHREKTGSCLQCHASRKDNDFVLKGYGP